jgi:beta-glucosidase
MGISTTQSTREHGSATHNTAKQQQQELDIEHVLTQLTLEEKISLTAGMFLLDFIVTICTDKI